MSELRVHSCRPSAGWASAFALLLTGCTVDELSQSYQLDRLRILAVRATPAEPRPGDTITLDAYTYDPEDRDLGILWFGCLPDSADEFGCATDPTVLGSLLDTDFSSLTKKEIAALYEKLLAAGVIGLEPLFPATWTVPSDALDGLDPTAALEGVSAIVSLQALPLVEGADPNDAELAYKRVPISLAKTPNQNPDILGLAFEGTILQDGGRVEVGHSAEYSIEPAVPDEAIEKYTYVDEKGVAETRTEEPYFTYYAEGGTFDQPYSLWPSSIAYWTAPEEAGEYEIRCVMRDRRGGMGWARMTAVVR
jgi:hypothetical protein